MPDSDRINSIPSCWQRPRDSRMTMLEFWPPMPLSNKEKQEAFRAKHAIEGAAEVRGIYLPLELHAKLKALGGAVWLRDRINRAKLPAKG